MNVNIHDITHIITHYSTILFLEFMLTHIKLFIYERLLNAHDTAKTTLSKTKKNTVMNVSAIINKQSITSKMYYCFKFTIKRKSD